MADEKIYLGKDGKQQGPFTLEQLQAQGIDPGTLVWQDGMAGWQPVEQLPELKSLIKKPAPAPAPAPQPAPNPPYPPQPQDNKPGVPCPNNNLVWAILVTIFCCMPLGIVAIIKAASVNTLYAQGQYIQATEAARQARNWAIWAACAAAVVWMVYILFFVVLAAASSSGY